MYFSAISIGVLVNKKTISNEKNCSSMGCGYFEDDNWSTSSNVFFILNSEYVRDPRTYYTYFDML